ncbi:MAG: hypothetical protein WBZ36_22155 [Candidatus Nitrosopolaris sp.]
MLPEDEYYQMKELSIVTYRKKDLIRESWRQYIDKNRKLLESNFSYARSTILSILHGMICLPNSSLPKIFLVVSDYDLKLST